MVQLLHLEVEKTIELCNPVSEFLMNGIHLLFELGLSLFVTETVQLIQPVMVVVLILAVYVVMLVQLALQLLPLLILEIYFGLDLV